MRKTFFRIPLYLNLSRGFLDSVDASLRSKSLIPGSHCIIKKTNQLQTQETKILQNVLDFLHNTVFVSILFQAALIRVFNEWNYSVKVEEVITLFKNLDIRFVSEVNFEGMVGLQNVVYITENCFKQSEGVCKTRLLRLILHEGMHSALRRLHKNFLKITPPAIIKEGQEILKEFQTPYGEPPLP